MPGPRLIFLSRLGELLVFGDASSSGSAGGYSRRGRYPAGSGNKAICDRDGFNFLAAALTDHSASLPLASATASSMAVRLTCLK